MAGSTQDRLAEGRRGSAPGPGTQRGPEATDGARLEWPSSPPTPQRQSQSLAQDVRRAVRALRLG